MRESRIRGTPAVGITLALILPACSDPTGPADNVWDLERDGVPEFVSTFYLDADPIVAISRFRSGVGHDYHDDFETCRSMKHYLLPDESADWSTLRVYAPVAGTIVRREDEWAGVQLWVRSSSHPAFEFRIFHVTLTAELKEGDAVAAGAQLGTHVGNQTMSDIAVSVNTPDGMRHISFFEVLTDQAMSYFLARGVTSRAQLVITEAERDADPLGCATGGFGEGTLPNWVHLTPVGGGPAR